MDPVKQGLTEDEIETESEAVDGEVENLVNSDEQTNEDKEVEEAEEVILNKEQQENQDLKNEVKELNDRLLRVQADYDNFRRRTRQDKEAAAKYRAQNLIEEIIPAIDNFDRALGVKAESEEAKALLQGMEMVYRQLTEALKNEGLEVIKAVGERFDPHYHQAVMQVETEEYEANQVVEELQKGYQLKGRVIRPAMVKVKQ